MRKSFNEGNKDTVKKLGFKGWVKSIPSRLKNAIISKAKSAFALSKKIALPFVCVYIALLPIFLFSAIGVAISYDVKTAINYIPEMFSFPFLAIALFISVYFVRKEENNK